MRKQTVTLQGSDIIVSEAAAQVVRAYLSELRKMTVFRKDLRRTSIETLRDICLQYTAHKPSVSKLQMQRAVELVGLPDHRLDGMDVRELRRTLRLLRGVHRALGAARTFVSDRGVWLWRGLYAAVGLCALVAAVGDGVLLYDLLQQAAKPIEATTQTSIGQVTTAP